MEELDYYRQELDEALDAINHGSRLLIHLHGINVHLNKRQSIKAIKELLQNYYEEAEGRAYLRRMNDEIIEIKLPGWIGVDRVDLRPAVSVDVEVK